MLVQIVPTQISYPHALRSSGLATDPVIFGESLTIWTIRAAIALYGFAVAAQLIANGRDTWRRAARWFWTLGCVIYVIHVLVAFHFYHHWSHAAVFEHTARRTEAVVGARVGYGVFASYLFTILWVVDAVAWWRSGLERYAERPRWLHALLHGFFAFIVFNGTVIFEAGPIRWFGIGLFSVFAVLLVWAGWRRPATNLDLPAAESLDVSRH